jgi:hypothetical protein
MIDCVETSFPIVAKSEEEALRIALGVVCRLAGCRPVQPNRRGTTKDQVHSDEKAEDHVTLTHRTREKEHCSNQQSETGK